MNLELSELPKAGTRLGRFRVDGVLGSGGSGIAYRAFDEVLETPVCLKVLHPAVADHPETLARFKRELLLARRVAHPGICRLFDLHEEKELRFLSMELVEGTVLRERFRGGAVLDVETTLLLGERLARALAAAHAAAVVHRDLKPQNIIVREGDDPCILDFGIATAVDVTHVTRPGVPLGTRHYIPPEVWKGEKATPASDLYALGVILFNCLTSRMPFATLETDQLVEMILREERLAPSAFRTDVPAAVDDVVLSCIALRPSDRPKSAEALADRLAALRESLPPPEERGMVEPPPTVPAAPPATDPAEDAASSTGERAWSVAAPPSPAPLALPADTVPASESEITSVVRMLDADSKLSITHAPVRRGSALAVVVVAGLALGCGGVVAWLLARDAVEPTHTVVEAAPRVEVAPVDAEPPAPPPSSEEPTALAILATPPAPPASEDRDGRSTSAPTSRAGQRPKAARNEPRAFPRRPPERRPSQPRASAPRASEQRALEQAKGALRTAEAQRGVLRGDVPSLDALHRDLRRAERAGDLTAALRHVEEARRAVRALAIDDGFVRAKLARFNARFDAAPAGAGKDEAGALMGEVLRELGRGRYAQANDALNRAFRRLR